jgi:putative intracellular protease/amidase
MKGKILMVVTSHERIDEDHPTGLWLEEFAVPYDRFRAEGFDVTVASPRGGATPVDPVSEPKPEDAERWADARRALRETRRTDEVAAAPFAALFLPGGHGTMFDLPDDGALQDLIVEFLDAGKVVAAICHGPAALVNLRTAGGRPLVAGRTLTAFTDAEEREVGLAERMPFLLETTLRERGARFVAGPNWSDHVERDGRLITGQNPQSSASAAQGVLAELERAVSPASAEAPAPAG